jgi:hypothetical protein
LNAVNRITKPRVLRLVTARNTPESCISTTITYSFHY